eukprot:COSAG02_NODE_56018_length_287_cov_1.244681_1_plen_69_part_10
MDRVRLLLKRGATPSLANKKTKETPRELALAAGHQQVVALLDAGGDLARALARAAADGQTETVSALLED